MIECACKLVSGGKANAIGRAAAIACALVLGGVATSLGQTSPAATQSLAPPAAVSNTTSDRGASHYDEKPAAIVGLDINEKLGEKIPLDLSLVDSTGAKVRLGDWFNQGKPVLVIFVYYRCPLVCPQLLERYARTFRMMDTLTIGRDYNVLVISIDPTDKPEKAAETKATWLLNYDRQPEKSVSAGWAFLTSPDASTTRKIADSLGFPYRYLPAANDYSHPSATFVLSPSGMVCRYLYGIEAPAQTLRLALVEAGEGKIGTSIDRAMLWCFHFDPKSGSYTFAAWRFMQAGGFLSAVVVAGLLVRMLMHEWRRKFAEQAAAEAAAQTKIIPGTGPQTAEIAR